MFGERKQLAFGRVWWLLISTLLVGVGARKSRSPLYLEPASPDPSVTCAVNLARSYLADTTHITMLGDAPWLADFIKTSSVPVTLLYIENKGVQVLNLIYDVLFLLIDETIEGYNVTTTLKQLKDRNAFYARVVIWSQTGDPQACVDAARVEQVVRLAVVNGSSGAQQVFGYHEECDNMTRIARAVLKGKCGPIGFLEADGDLFPDVQRFDFGGCPMCLKVNPYGPHRILTPEPEGGYTLTGSMSVLPFEIAKRMNATLNASPLEGEETFDGDCEIYHNLYAIAYYDSDYEFGPGYYRSCVSLIVPSEKGMPPSSFTLLYGEFSLAVWALVGVVCVVFFAFVAVSWRGVSERPEEDAALFILSTLFANSSRIQPLVSDRLRMLASFWFMFSIVMCTAYQAALHSLQAAPEGLPEINSLTELVDSNLLIEGRSYFLRQLKHAWKYSGGNSSLDTLNRRRRNSTDDDQSLHRVAFSRNVAMTCPWDFIVVKINMYEQQSGRKLVHKIPGFCSSESYLTYFLFPRGSYIAPSIDHVVTRALDVGLLAHIHSQFVFPRTEVKQGWVPIGFTNVKAVFQVLGFGLVISTLVLLVEFLKGYSVIK